MTVLRGIDFGPCWDAPGVRGWNGEGYWYHRIPPFNFWLDFTGSTRVSKTTTLLPRIPPAAGNMPVGGADKLWGPLEWFPKCIWVNPFDGRTLNSVALTGPGARELINHGLLEDPEHFMVSFMSVASEPYERVMEFEKFLVLFIAACIRYKVLGRVALQINISCPNTGLNTAHLIHEAMAMLDLAKRKLLGRVPVVIKLNLLPPVEVVKEIAAHSMCDALCVTNAMPFGTVPDKIAWNTLYPKGSPLMHRDKKFGGGGYSGPELLPLVADFICRAKDAGVEKPWNAGGGIRHPDHVDFLVNKAGLRRGVDSIFFASAAMVRPWNVQPIIRRAHELLG